MLISLLIEWEYKGFKEWYWNYNLYAFEMYDLTINFHYDLFLTVDNVHFRAYDLRFLLC